MSLLRSLARLGGFVDYFQRSGKIMKANSSKILNGFS